MNVIEFTRVEDRQLAANDVWQSHPDIITRSRNLNDMFYLSFDITNADFDIDSIFTNHNGMLKPNFANDVKYSIDSKTKRDF